MMRVAYKYETFYYLPEWVRKTTESTGDPEKTAARRVLRVLCGHLLRHNKSLPIKITKSQKEPSGYDSTVGINVSIPDFVTIPSGTKIDNPKLLRDSIKRLKVLQRRASQKKKESKNRDEAKYQVAKRHEKITNQRKDFLHKVSSKVVIENQESDMETLNVDGTMKTHRLAQAIGDASVVEFFRQFEYKYGRYGKTLLRIGGFEPASKMCSVCRSINRCLKFPDREWTCAECAPPPDRDVNERRQHKEIRASGSKPDWRNSNGGQPG